MNTEPLPLIWGHTEETRRMSLDELPREAGIERAVAIIAQRHERIGRAIRTLWGTRECIEYLEKLVINCGDHFRKTRAGFHPEVVSAMLSLICMHRIERR